MARRAAAALMIAVVLASAPLAAIYMRVETTDVPVDRLVGNLEKEQQYVATLLCMCSAQLRLSNLGPSMVPRGSRRGLAASPH